ncbi:hypothetical protein IFU04_25170 [Pseudomonas syringae]|nr:hypothetical protein [Pseudomonas syringae]
MGTNMASEEPLRHRDFAMLYIFGALVGLWITWLWYSAGDETFDWFLPTFVTVVCGSAPLQAIVVAIFVALNKSERVSRFAAFRRVVQK